MILLDCRSMIQPKAVFVWQSHGRRRQHKEIELAFASMASCLC
jgi:hypothetical protein